MVTTQEWADSNYVIINELGVAVASVSLAMTAATSLGNRLGDGPDLRTALNEVATIARQCGNVIDRAVALPSMDDAQADRAWRDMLLARREWVENLERAAPGLDPVGMTRANEAAARASACDRALPAAVRAAWPDS